MNVSRLDEILKLCEKIAEVNKTESLVHRVECFIRKNAGRIRKETEIVRSKKRRVFGKLESHIVELLMKLCNYSCPKYNVILVHRVMALLGYGGYEGDKRFRQRTENTLKKWKKIKESGEEDDDMIDYSVDEIEDGLPVSSLPYKSRLWEMPRIQDKGTVSNEPHTKYMHGMSDEEKNSAFINKEKNSVDISSDCSSTVVASPLQDSSNTGSIAFPNAISVFDYDLNSFGQDQGDMFNSKDYCFCLNEKNDVSSSLCDPYWE